MNEQIKQYKETLNYANVLSELLRNVYRAWEYGQSGWGETKILLKALPPLVRDDLHDVLDEYEKIKAKIEKLPKHGSRLGRDGSISWQEDVYTIEYDFAYGYAIERVVEALDRHHLLIYSDRPVEAGQYYNLEDLKPDTESNEGY